MLFKILTAPLMAPIGAVKWVGEKLQDAALAQIYDTESIKRELSAYEGKLDRGEMTEEDYEAVEMVLIDRLKEAGRRLKQANAG